MKIRTQRSVLVSAWKLMRHVLRKSLLEKVLFFLAERFTHVKKAIWKKYFFLVGKLHKQSTKVRLNKCVKSITVD